MNSNLKKGQILLYKHPKFRSYKIILLERQTTCGIPMVEQCQQNCNGETWSGMVIWTDLEENEIVFIPGKSLLQFEPRFCVGDSSRFFVIPDEELEESEKK